MCADLMGIRCGCGFQYNIIRQQLLEPTFRWTNISYCERQREEQLLITPTASYSYQRARRLPCSLPGLRLIDVQVVVHHREVDYKNSHALSCATQMRSSTRESSNYPDSACHCQSVCRCQSAQQPGAGSSKCVFFASTRPSRER
jgi:hypothetical protein